MSTYLNLLTDFGFKKIFADSNKKSFLIDLLNTLLKEEEQITELNFLPNEHLGQFKLDRSAIFDLYCTNQKGEHFLVELQRAPQSYFVDRTVYYSSLLIQKQATKGDTWDFKLKPIYSIALLNFIIPKIDSEPDKLYHKLQLREVESGKIYFKKMTYIYIELPKFKKTEQELNSHFDKWIYILSNIESLTHEPEQLKESIFMSLLKKAEFENLSLEERERYALELKVFRDNYNTLEYAKTTGIEIGFEQGKYENQKATILNGFAEGLSIQILSKISGLSEDEVMKIIRENH